MGIFSDCGCGCDGRKQEKKLFLSLMAALTFFIIASPETFRIMRKFLGKWVSSPTGCPTSSGLLLHTIVFMLVTWGLMNIKSEGYETESMDNDSELVDDALEVDRSESKTDTSSNDLSDFHKMMSNGFVKSLGGSDSTIQDNRGIQEPVIEVEEPVIEIQEPVTEIQEPVTETRDFHETLTDDFMKSLNSSDSLAQRERQTGVKLQNSYDKDITNDPSRKGLVPVRMADVELPLPGMIEEPIGLYDSGSILGHMDIYSELDTPFTEVPEIPGRTLSISCSDGTKPISI
tara:strand:+ start:2270 stop:3133 length:864 start_codon:yes stop_codon:yes gene_type:complete